MYVTNFIVAAARWDEVQDAVEEMTVDGVAGMLKTLIEREDGRVTMMPLPFQHVLSQQLVQLHAFGFLYESGFSKSGTVAMLVNSDEGRIEMLWLPDALAGLLGGATDAQAG